MPDQSHALQVCLSRSLLQELGALCPQLGITRVAQPHKRAVGHLVEQAGIFAEIFEDVGKELESQLNPPLDMTQDSLRRSLISPSALSGALMPKPVSPPAQSPGTSQRSISPVPWRSSRWLTSAAKRPSRRSSRRRLSGRTGPSPCT